jgi:hypothetical protein
MLERLEAGADPAELAAFLRSELQDHFGLDADRLAAGTEWVSRSAVALRDGG